MWSWLKKDKNKNRFLICIYTYPGSNLFSYYHTEHFFKKIPDNYDVILVYGHDGKDVLENNHLKLNHKEDYKSLPVKTFKMFKYLSNLDYQGFIKYDDDNKLLDPTIFDEVAVGDYSGFYHRHNPRFYLGWCRHKKIYRMVRKINTKFYFGGPLYYVSKKFAEMIAKEPDDILDNIWAEDALMGELYMKHKENLTLNMCKSTTKVMIENELGNYYYLNSQTAKK